jgi:hypothetical protein
MNLLAAMDEPTPRLGTWLEFAERGEAARICREATTDLSRLFVSNPEHCSSRGLCSCGGKRIGPIDWGAYFRFLALVTRRRMNSCARLAAARWPVSMKKFPKNRPMPRFEAG